MNCKEGDLALVVKGDARFLGMVVECIEYVEAPPPVEGRGFKGRDYWKVDKKFPYSAKDMKTEAYYIRDERLKPITPDPYDGLSEEEIKILEEEGYTPS